ncbi:MAG TPA: hypothetical protein VME17_14735 [Bryobacteraceae bacterium]|nr:hypothetical protein [Bryobacteraceae bacterium]
MRSALDHASLGTQAADWTEYPQPKSEDLREDVSALVTEPV